MIFEKRFHPKVKNDLKKIDKQVVKKIQNIHINNIVQDPYKYPRLKGNLSRFRSYHFNENGVEYRIAYEIIEDAIVLYLIIAKRENFYNNFWKRVQ